MPCGNSECIIFPLEVTRLGRDDRRSMEREIFLEADNKVIIIAVFVESSLLLVY